MIIEKHKICNEMLDVLAKHRVPMYVLDRVLDCLKDMALSNTPIQNIDLQKEHELKKIESIDRTIL